MNVRKTQPTLRTDCLDSLHQQQLTQEERAAKTLIYFSQEARQQDHLLPTHYHRRFIQRQSPWGEEWDKKGNHYWFRTKKDIQSRHKKNKTHLQKYQSPSNMLLELTKSVEAVEPSRDYRVTVKPRCVLNSSTHLQNKEHKMFRRKLDRQKVRFSNHIIPTPRVDQKSVEFVACKKRQGGAIKKIKRDIIRSFQSKIQNEQDKWVTAMKQITKDRGQKSQKVEKQIGSQTMFETGKFRESIKLKMKKYKRQQKSTTKINLRSYKGGKEILDPNKQKSSINKSQQFQLLQSLLQLQKY